MLPIEQNYLIMIDYFYKNCSENKIMKMLNIIDGTSNITLRYIDNHAREKFKESYQFYLKVYTMKYFDFFRRGTTLDYEFIINNEKRLLKTTIGQLICFKWIIENDII